MATYLDREQIHHRRAIQHRYDADQQRLALLIAFLLTRFAQFDATGKRTIPTDTRTRLMLKGAIWAQILRPYYIGNGTEPFNQSSPQSQFAQLVYDGVEGATRIQVQRQQSLVKKYIKDAAVLAWLFMPGPQIQLPEPRQEMYKAPFWAYTDPNGYKLNDRILRNAVDSRAKIDRMLDWHIDNGSSVEVMGAEAQNFMTIRGRASGKPYGDYGSYAPWKMTRGEMLTAAGRATVLLTMLNPVVDMVQWRLSPSHHDTDQCDDNASGGQNGDGVYPANNAPAYPNHANCLCTLMAVSSDSASDEGVQLRDAIQARNVEASRLRGAMNADGLMGAMMGAGVGEPA